MRRAYGWLLGLTCALAVAAVVLSALVMQGLRDVSSVRSEQIEAVLLADELRQSSDDLTNLARLHVITGNDRYRTYFDRVLAIRSGQEPRPEGYEGTYWDFVLADPTYEVPAGDAVSLTDRMRKLGFSPTEFSLLRSAEDRSDALADIEGSAFAALEAGEQQIAVELVSGSEYLEAKASIMEPIDQFLAVVRDRTSQEIVQAQEHMAQLSRALLGVVMALLGAVITLTVGWRRQ